MFYEMYTKFKNVRQKKLRKGGYDNELCKVLFLCGLQGQLSEMRPNQWWD